MKFLVIGLGSMGKRRIRNLQYLGYTEILGLDLRMDRREEVKFKYGIETFSDIEQVQDYKIDALIISVPPDKHHVYMLKAIELNLPCFVEASVVDNSLDEIISLAESKKVFVAPSSTMYFHPAIKRIKSIVDDQVIGKVNCISYHSGQYLPDWHTYENVKDFYVSNKETGGAREIVPFELTWITKIFGFPTSVRGIVKKTIDIEGADLIDDTYVGIFDFENFILTLTIDVTSRIATRKLLINGSNGQLLWDWNNDFIDIYTPEKGWQKVKFKMLAAEEGYNKNITEQMYIDEISCFISGIEDNHKYINDLGNDWAVLKLLYALEESSNNKKIIFFK